MRDQHRLAQPGLDRRGGVADMDHKRAAANPGAVDPFRRETQIMRDRRRRLANGREAINVRRLRPHIAKLKQKPFNDALVTSGMPER